MRFLHTMLRVGNLEASLKFYVDVLGMRLLRQQDFTDGRFTLAYMGYNDEATGTVLELTHNWDTEEYDIGEGYGHIAIGVDDVYAAADKIKAAGGKIVREAGPMMHGKTILAFAEDPDGYKVELLSLNN